MKIVRSEKNLYLNELSRILMGHPVYSIHLVGQSTIWLVLALLTTKCTK
jgi:hypothetical protein